MIKSSDPSRAIAVLPVDGGFVFDHLTWREPLIEGCHVFDEGGWIPSGRSAVFAAAKAAERAGLAALGET